LFWVGREPQVSCIGDSRPMQRWHPSWSPQPLPWSRIPGF